MAAPEQWRTEHPEPFRPDRRNVFVNSTEAYLRAIYEIEEEDGIAPQRTALRRRLGISRSAVSQHVARLIQDGLVTLSPQRRVVLTAEGWAAATVVMRKHRLAERVLVDVIGLEWELSHIEASRWQHVLGEVVERKLLDLLDDPGVSPYGNPIPGLDGLDPSRRPAPSDDDPALVPLLDAARSGGVSAVVRRIPEPLQSDRSLLARMWTAGVVPGRVVGIALSGSEAVRTTAAAGELLLDTRVAGAILVERHAAAGSALGSCRSLAGHERSRF